MKPYSNSIIRITLRITIFLLTTAHQSWLIAQETYNCYSPYYDEAVLDASSQQEMNRAIKAALTTLSSQEIQYTIKQCLDTVPLSPRTTYYFRYLFEQAISLYALGELTLADLHTFGIIIDRKMQAHEHESPFAVLKEEEDFVSYMHRTIDQLSQATRQKSSDTSASSPSMPEESPRIRRRERFALLNAGTQPNAGIVTGALHARDLAIARNLYQDQLGRPLTDRINADFADFVKHPHRPLGGYTAARIQVLFDILIKYATPTPQYRLTFQQAYKQFGLVKQFVEVFKTRLAAEFKGRSISEAFVKLSDYIRKTTQKQIAFFYTLKARYELAQLNAQEKEEANTLSPLRIRK